MGGGGGGNFWFHDLFFCYNSSSLLVPNLRAVKVNTSDDENHPCHSVIAFDTVTGNTTGMFFCFVYYSFLCRQVSPPCDKVVCVHAVLRTTALDKIGRETERRNSPALIVSSCCTQSCSVKHGILASAVRGHRRSKVTQRREGTTGSAVLMVAQRDRVVREILTGIRIHRERQTDRQTEIRQERKTHECKQH